MSEGATTNTGSLLMQPRTRVRGSDLTPEAASSWSCSPSSRTSSASTCTYGETASVRLVVTNLRLPGQYDERLLGSLGLQGPYYNWNRWYLPGVGRYLEPDPLALAGRFNTPYGVDWYGYAGQNPMRWTDPWGLWYLDLNVSGGYWGGFTFGFMLDWDAGTIHPYLGGGLLTPGIGAALTWSPSDVSRGWNFGLQGQAGLAGQLGYALDGGWFWEGGVGWPPGASLTGYYVFKDPFRRCE